jgi:chloramphenicol 3-O-phosphotransferase
MARNAGQIIILNGVPRSGKSSIVAEIQANFDGLWMSLGVDRFMACTPGSPVPPPVLRWQQAVHVPGVYDLEVDTSLLTPGECADAIRRRLAEGPAGSAFRRIAEMSSDCK